MYTRKTTSTPSSPRPRRPSGVEAARVQPAGDRRPARDAFTRLLHRPEPGPPALWEEASPQVDEADGTPVIDDPTLDEPHATSIGLVGRRWSGEHHAVAEGIGLVTLLRSDCRGTAWSRHSR